MGRPSFTLPDPAAIDVAEIPAVIGQLEAIKAQLYARLAGPVSTATPAENSDRLLTVDDVHEQTQLSVRWLYRHADVLPFTRRIGRKVLFSSTGLAKWLATRRP